MSARKIFHAQKQQQLQLPRQRQQQLLQQRQQPQLVKLDVEATLNQGINVSMCTPMGWPLLMHKQLVKAMVPILPPLSPKMNRTLCLVLSVELTYGLVEMISLLIKTGLGMMGLHGIIQTGGLTDQRQMKVKTV